MGRQRRLLNAIALAFVTTMLTVSSAFAHAAEDPSLAHRVLDSAAIPVLGLGVLGAVTAVWWWRNGRHQQSS